jgi:hypothetical protein
MEGTQCFKTTKEVLSIQVVGLKYVASHYNEITVFVVGYGGDSRHCIDSLLIEPWMRIGIEKVTRHAELPVRGMQKSEHQNLLLKDAV